MYKIVEYDNRLYEKDFIAEPIGVIESIFENEENMVQEFGLKHARSIYL